ncbi:MAG: hypothetical protein ACRDTI_20775 [Mycobacterium sp.]
MNSAQFRAMLNAAGSTLPGLVRALLSLYGVPVTAEQRYEIASQLIAPARTSRSVAFRAAGVYLGAMGAQSALPSAPQTYGLGAPIAMMRRLVDDQGVTELDRRDTLQVVEAGERFSRGMQRHIEAPARDLVRFAADGDPDGAWARVLTGARSCAFCAMLASRGPVYSRKDLIFDHGPGKSVVNGVRVDAYHDGCDCIAVYIPGARRSTDWEGYKQWQLLQNAWRDADNDEDDGRATRLVFRSWWEREVRQGRSHRYIADSLQPAAS